MRGPISSRIAIFRRASIIGAVAATVATGISACSLNPYIESPKRSKPATSLDAANVLDQALARVHTARADMEKEARQQARIRSLANTGVLVGTIGALASGLYQGSRDLIVGFGLGGGASYVGSAVYAPAGLGDAYRSGVGALNCIDSVASPAAATIASVRSPRNDLAARLEELQKLIAVARDVDEKSPSRGLTDALARADTAYTNGFKARIAVDSLLAKERLLAAQLNLAVDQTIEMVNKRVNAQHPDPATVAQLARSVGAIGLGGIGQAAASMTQAAGFVKQQAAAKAQMQGMVLESDGEPNADLIKRLDEAVERTAAAVAVIPKSLDVALDAAKGSLAGCKLEDLATTALTAAPAGDIALKPGQPYTFSVTGGTRPYFARFLGDRPKDVETDPVSHTGAFVVRGPGAAPESAAAHVLLIEDSTPRTRQTLQITVNVAKKE